MSEYLITGNLNKNFDALRKGENRSLAADDITLVGAASAQRDDENRLLEREAVDNTQSMLKEAILKEINSDKKRGHTFLPSIGASRGPGSVSPMFTRTAASGMSGTSGISGANFSSAGGNITTSPSFYSPIHTPVNWQIPSKRREVYLWCRFFAQYEPKIAASLRFYSQFPFNGFKHEMQDPVRKEYFDRFRKRIRLDYWLPLIAYEYFAMGDVFIYSSFSCPECGGTGQDKNGEKCWHKGGTIGGITVLNPDSISVQTSEIDPLNPIIMQYPSEGLKQIVASQRPPELYDRIPNQIKELIAQGKPWKLSNRSVTHLKHDEIPYHPYGRSLLAPLFPTLAYQDKLRQAQWIVAERHILPIKIVKVGNEQRPAGPRDIADTQAQLASVANDPNLTLVTHNAFEFEWVGANGKVLQLTKEYDLIDKNIIQGLGVNEALLSGTGPSYSQAAIGIEATIRRLGTVRDTMKYLICEKIYRHEAAMQGFYKEDMNGNQILDYPDLRWEDLNLRDETQKKQFSMQIWEKGLISSETFCEETGYDYNKEVEKVRLEQMYHQQIGVNVDGGKGPKGGGGMGGGFLGGGGGGGGGGAPSDEMKGNMPGGAEAPGLPGDEIAPSLSGGEGGGGAPSGMAKTDTQLAIEMAPNVHRPNKFRLRERMEKEKRQEERRQKEEAKQKLMEYEQQSIYEGPRTGLFNLTSIEKIIYAAIADAQSKGHLPDDFLLQATPEPVKMPRVVVDGVFPSIRLIIQADGKMFHDNNEKIQEDANINQRFNNLGWTVLRYTEDEIENHIDEVISHIIKVADELKKNMQGGEQGVQVMAMSLGGYGQLRKFGKGNVVMIKKNNKIEREKF